MKSRRKSLTAVAWLLFVTFNLTIWYWNLEELAWSNGLNSNTNAREQVMDAFSRTEQVILGSVVGIRNYLHTDGGYSYEIDVSEVLKGNQADKYSVQAGGWAYQIPFNYGDTVLLFLNQSNSLPTKESFVLALDHEHKPLAFRVEAGQLIGVATPLEWHSSLDGYSLEQVKEMIRRK